MKSSGGKKRVVFVTRRRIMDGIEKALISMLESMPKDEYEITVLVMGNGGEFIDEIPNHVEIKCLYGNEQSIREKIWIYTKKGKLINAFRIGLYTVLAKTVYKQEMYQSKMLPIVETEYNLAEYLVLLGTKNNSYPYIKQCDIYVQPLRHEGYGISLAEARAFNKSIVTTDFVGAREQIENGQDGLITRVDESAIYSAIEKLISNKALCAMF